jgi:hypothetical protein
VKPIGKNHLEDKGDSRIILRWISKIQIVRMEGGWN